MAHRHFYAGHCLNPFFQSRIAETVSNHRNMTSVRLLYKKHLILIAVCPMIQNIAVCLIFMENFEITA